MALWFYPALIVQDAHDTPEAGYGVVFPDFPGCVTMGDTVQEAALYAIEALGGHVEVMADSEESIPQPSELRPSLSDWLEDPTTRVAAAIMVPVELPGRIHADITLDEELLGRLDAAAAAEGVSRSGYIARAVRARLEAASSQARKRHKAPA